MNSTVIHSTEDLSTQPSRAAYLLANARLAIEQGRWKHAYQLSLEATRLSPENVEAWFLRFQTAISPEERLFCLSQVNRLHPGYPEAKMHSYQIIWDELDREPFLAFEDETDDLYFVRSKAYLSLAIPKGRAVPEKYPSERPESLKTAYRWLAWAALGLFFSGIGTLVCAPLAVRAALKALRSSLPQPERNHTKIVLLLSFLLLLPALFLFWIFIVHLVG